MSPSRNRRTDRTAGFTLLEAILAIVIAGLLLQAALTLFSSGLQRSERRRLVQSAAALAESLLERIGVESPLQAGTVTGASSDGFRWTIRTEPADSLSGSASPTIAAYRIQVEVAPAGGLDRPLVTLDSLKLSPR